jgi:hypothetical protein
VASLVLCTGFETGQIGATGELFTTVSTAGGTPTAQTGTVRSGTYAMQVNKSSAGSSKIDFDQTGGATDKGVMRFAIRFSSMPGAVVDLARVKATAGTNATFRVTNTDVFRVGVGGQTVDSSTTLVAGRWYLIDIRFDPTVANARTIEWYIDGVLQPQATGTTVEAASTISGFQLGSPTVADVVNVFYDDWACSLTSADFPIGDGRVYKLSPSSDGTHNTGSAGNFTNAAGTNITNATTDAYTYVDEVVPDSADRIEQRLDTSGSLYVEVNFADLDAGMVNGVRAWLGYHGAGTGGNALETRIRDAAGQETTLFSGAYNVTSIAYKGVMVTAPAAGWSNTTVNGLKARFGYGTDVTPDGYCDWLMLEVDVRPVTPWAIRPRLQAVNRAAVI